MEGEKVALRKAASTEGPDPDRGDLHEWFFDVQTISGEAGDRSIPTVSEFDRYQPTHPSQGFLQFKQIPLVRLQFQP
jgi:hypothetical protein